MQKSCIIILIVAIIFLSLIGLSLPKEQTHEEYLRIHIRADSNLEEDQTVKYLVKDAVILYLTPFIAECKTKEQAEKMLDGKLKDIENVADGILSENGFEYKCKAGVRREEFPTRIYGNLQLEKGFYDALILELGSGNGDNWWCVVYPPLCFTGAGANYVYKSKIKDVIDDFFSKQGESKKNEKIY